MDGNTGRRIVALPLSSIIVDPRVWPRGRHDEDRVSIFANLYEEQGLAALPPVEICAQGDRSVCSDGAHRRLAAEVAGLDQLGATIIEVPETEDLITFAFVRAIGASTKGHKELTWAERDKAIRRLIDETELGDAQIAELFGVTRQTIWRHRQRVTDATPPQSEEAGEGYVATIAAEEVARRLFRGLEKVYEARGLGLWDYLTHDRSGERLARILNSVYGDDALITAEMFRTWFDWAIAELTEEPS
jgi:hypothetical protein